MELLQAVALGEMELDRNPIVSMEAREWRCRRGAPGEKSGHDG